MSAATTNHWLIRALVAAGVQEAADAAITAGMKSSDLWDAVAHATGLSEQAIVERAAPRLRLEAAALHTRNSHVDRLVPDRIMQTHNILPLRESDRQLVVASADPMDFEAEQELSFASGRTVVFELAGPQALERAIRSSHPNDDELEELLSRLDPTVGEGIRLLEEVEPDTSRGGGDAQAPTVVKLMNLILSEAIAAGASDIHIEPTATTAFVRFRVDGVLRPYMQLPLNGLVRVVSRLKVLGQMDIANRVRPQDGRARVLVRNREYDLRISTVPASGTEKAVIRVLYPKTADKLDDLKLSALDTSAIRRLLSHREGVVIVTGPTGSGKTTTLYSALRELATGKINITTVEDPVEYELAGITQIQVETKRGVTFASALRAILRQDPDVVLIGEIRDNETAHIALQAALTGHLVLGTLHTNDAPTAVTRLLDLGLEPKNIAAALRGVIAQRLVRRVCFDCAQPVGDALRPDEDVLARRYGVHPVMRAIGCDRCNGTGYRGRIPVVEVLSANSQIEEAIGSGAAAIDIRRHAAGTGMRSLLESGFDRVREGVTTLQEVERVLGTGQDLTAAEPQDALGRPHVVVADDDEIVREIAADALQQAGMRVTQVADGEAVFEVLRDEPVSLLVLDLDMPRLDGLGVLRRVRANLSTASLPVIISTANREAEIAVMDEGADDYLQKPLDPPRLVSRVRAVLRRHMQH